jgi:hypothetical protein
MHTSRWLSLALVLGCLTARADMANPWTRYVSPRLAFAGVQNHPDHVFLIHVRDQVHWANPFESRVIPILGPEPFWPDFDDTVDKVAVIAVPKAAYERLSEEERQNLSPKSPGVLSCDIVAPRSVVLMFQPDPGTAPYRVAITDGNLCVEPASLGERECSIVPPFRSRQGWWALAVAASVAWLGFVVSRRLVRGKS